VRSTAEIDGSNNRPQGPYAGGTCRTSTSTRNEKRREEKQLAILDLVRDRVVVVQPRFSPVARGGLDRCSFWPLAAAFFSIGADRAQSLAQVLIPADRGISRRDTSKYGLIFWREYKNWV
jgi:hypothetical protein